MRTTHWPLLALCLATACNGQPQLSWEMSFAAGADSARAVLVEGRILEGGCDGVEVWSARAGRGDTPSMPPELEAGTYGFEGRAIDASCTVFAEGCVEVTVPADDASVTVELAPRDEVAECPAAECTDGVCGAAGDAGAMDAGDLDAGDRDAGPPDAGPPDSGPPTGCTMDAECGECERCNGTTCEPDTSATTCTGGTCVAGACCTGCVISGACVSGNDDAACGSGGAACQACACPTDRCDAGACTVGRPIDDLAATSEHMCVITSGSMFCFGNNIFGNLGIGTSGVGTEVDVPTAPTTSVSFTSVAAGDDHVLGLSSGAMHVWGSNSDGQLGLGDMGDRTTPVMVSGPTTWSSAEGATGGDHSCGLRSDALYCAGQNDFGQLGLGDLAPRSAFTQVPGTWTAVGLGHHHTCAITTTGALFCWGENALGQLGLGDSGIGTDRNAPTQVGTDTDWLAVAGGDSFTCGIRSPGDLYCWGENADGQLGLGSVTMQVTPQRVGADTNWASVRLGVYHACALKTDGALFCWGRNASGQLGQGTSGADVRSPTRVGGATGWSDLALGAAHTCALTPDRALHCWGDNTLGQLGLGDRTQRIVPTPVCW